MPFRKKRERKYTKRVLVIGIIVGGVVGIWNMMQDNKEALDFLSPRKNVILSEGGMVYGAETTSAKTVGEFLSQNNIVISDDEVFPSLESGLYEGSHIHIQRKRKIHIYNGEEDYDITTDMVSVKEMLHENDISLNRNDLVLPSIHASLSDDIEVKIIRVSIERESVFKDIDFETITKEDDDMGWREEKIEQKGKKGTKEKIYDVVYHNGEEIDRELMEEYIKEEPRAQIVTKGTHVKLGKSHKGQASWYAWTGTLAAANPWLPKGSYVKVTNRANGKSVIVVINDRGPFVPGRIIDLDKVAFEKIASIGAGVIDVKMEEIKN